MALSSKTQAMAALFEFSLNIFTEFSDKNICHYSKRAQTCHPATSYARDQDAITALARHVRDKIFKLNPIHASVIYQIPWIQWIPFPFCENSIVLLPMETKIRWVVAWYRFSRSHKHVFCQFWKLSKWQISPSFIGDGDSPEVCFIRLEFCNKSYFISLSLWSIACIISHQSYFYLLEAGQ